MYCWSRESTRFTYRSSVALSVASGEARAVLGPQSEANDVVILDHERTQPGDLLVGVLEPNVGAGDGIVRLHADKADETAAYMLELCVEFLRGILPTVDCTKR